MSFKPPHFDPPTLQLIRYEALFKLIDDIQDLDDIAEIAKRAATQWKYFANVACWRLVVPNRNVFKVIDGWKGNAQVNHLETLTEWDQFHWDVGLPKLVHLHDADDIPAPPVYMMGKDIVDIIVLPFSRMGTRSGLLSVSARNVPFTELDKKFIRLFGQHFSDRIAGILLRRQATQLLTERATHDALTGLLNRGTIVERLKSQLSLSRRTNAPLSVILIDIDFFKHVNDRFGHSAGDAVLCEVARRIQEQTRDGDSLGRFGGEEFLAVLAPCDKVEVALAAERFRLAIEASDFLVNDATSTAISVTISLGTACTTDHGDDIAIETLLKRADDALYASKTQGRNRVTAASAA